MNQKLSEYHTGYRSFAGEVLQRIDFNKNSDDFVFDNEMVAQICFNRFQIAEITCPTNYNQLTSSINFRRSMSYGMGVLRTSVLYSLTKTGLYKWKLLTDTQLPPKVSARQEKAISQSLNLN
jgi:hypothetical protein